MRDLQNIDGALVRLVRVRRVVPGRRFGRCGRCVRKRVNASGVGSGDVGSANVVSCRCAGAWVSVRLRLRLRMRWMG